MTPRIERPVATNDWLPPRVKLRQRAIEAAVVTFERASYRQIVTPTFEDTALFERTSGEGSDVVTKEMYNFRDRGDRALTLRPEGTAPVVRAYLDALTREPLPVRLWYTAPMFRYARAQRGRYREHWQFGVEAIGSSDAAVDAEIIALQSAWYEDVGIAAGLALHLNSIGDGVCRPAYREALVAYFEPYRSELSRDSQQRLDVNPLRILDSKDASDQRIAEGAPRITDHLCPACAAHLAEVRAFLDARGVAYTLDPGLVRGLDYYERTAWEWILPGREGQATVSGGGRYDGLSELLGGERVPGVGFGCGIERVVLAMEEAGVALPPDRCDAYLVIEEADARPRLHACLDALRARGLHAEADLAGRSGKGQRRQAERLGARVVVACGPAEWARGTVRIGSDEIALDDVVDEVVRRVGAA